ncbi:MAG TPA: hypothetical protein VGM34_00810 [Chlamydiales bacterium]|jgi:hypothetical protein
MAINPIAPLTNLEKAGSAAILSSSLAGLLFSSLAVAGVMNPLLLLIPLFLGGSGVVCIVNKTASPAVASISIAQKAVNHLKQQDCPVRARNFRQKIALANIAEQNQKNPLSMQRWKNRIDPTKPMPADRAELVETAGRIHAARTQAKDRRGRLVAAANRVKNASSTLENAPQCKTESALGQFVAGMQRNVEKIGEALDRGILSLATQLQKTSLLDLGSGKLHDQPFTPTSIRLINPSSVPQSRPPEALGRSGSRPLQLR